MKLEAEWTMDCGGKQNYDAELVSLSTRYWPRGGGFLYYDPAKGEFEGNESRPDIKPSAKASIMLQDEDIISREFEGETEAEVKVQVEEWAREQFSKIETAIRNSFCPLPDADDEGETK